MAHDSDGFFSATRDISLGGLNFSWAKKIPKGTSIILSIPVKEKTFDVRARVAYAHESHVSSRFEIGVQFVDVPGAFRARLAEEVIQILEYRKRVSRESGEEITEEEAAKRWIVDNASDFPRWSPNSK